MVVVSVFAFAFFHLFIPMTSAQTEEEMIDIIVTYNDGVPNNKELSKKTIMWRNMKMSVTSIIYR